jgi:hypothetical protein
LDPKNAFALFKLGATQVERGEAERGRQSIETALQENPQMKNASYYLGARKCSWDRMKKP